MFPQIMLRKKDKSATRRRCRSDSNFNLSQVV